MWCPNCQSDVPQTAGSAIGSRRCCRCGRSPECASRRAGSDEGLDLENGPLTGPTTAASSAWDDWTLAAEVQRARLLLTHNSPGGCQATGWRIDGKHLLSVDPAEQAELRHNRPGVTRLRPIRQRSCGWPSLAAFTAGVVTFCCGVTATAALVDVSAALNRWGVPLMLIGLFGLAVGVLFQLHRMRRESHAALDRMRLLDLRLQEYRQAALLVGPTSNVGAGHRWELVGVNPRTVGNGLCAVPWGELR
jgi:hypothetical protein